MNTLLSYLNKYATLRNALIVMLLLFGIVIPINNRLTDLLYELANGVSKLDYHRTYDVAVVTQLFDAYGAGGKAMYVWDLIVDTFYPLGVALAAMLFALTVVRKPILQKLLIVLPLIFLVTDVIENAFCSCSLERIHRFLRRSLAYLVSSRGSNYSLSTPRFMSYSCSCQLRLSWRLCLS